MPFPSLIPSSRVLTPGIVESSVSTSLVGLSNTVETDVTLTGGQLELRFIAVPIADALLVSDWFRQVGTFQTFTLPSAIWSGASDATPAGYGWVFREDPQVEEFNSPGATCATFANVSVSLGLEKIFGAVAPGGEVNMSMSIAVTKPPIARGGSVMMNMILSGAGAVGAAVVPQRVFMGMSLAGGGATGGFAAGTAQGGNVNMTMSITGGGATGITSTAEGGNVNMTMSITGGGATGGTSSPLLILHMDGANNSTTFTDSGANGLTVTAYGNAKITTATSQFGGAGGSFDGTNSYIQTANDSSLTLGSSDFLLRMFCQTSSTAQQTLACRRDGFNTSGSWILFHNEGTAGKLVFYAVDYNSFAAPLLQATGISFSSLKDVAVRRSGNNWKLIVDGTVVDEVTASFSIGNNNQGITIGRDEAGGGRFYLNGTLDEVWLIKDYGGTYTVPTAPY